MSTRFLFIRKKCIIHSFNLITSNWSLIPFLVIGTTIKKLQCMIAKNKLSSSRLDLTFNIITNATTSLEAWDSCDQILYVNKVRLSELGYENKYGSTAT
jgi:hypothetical protein